MKRIKYIIISLIVIILLIVGILLSREIKKEGIIQYEEISNELIKTEVERETSAVNYGTVDDVINRFFNYISQNQDYFSTKEIVGEGFDFSQAVYNFLEKSYIERNHITKQIIERWYEEYKEFKSYSTKEVYKTRIEQGQDITNITFFAKGTVRKSGEYQYMYFIVRFDSHNYTYSIEPINDQEYHNYINGKTVIEEQYTIEKNDNNYKKPENLSTYDMCLKHMQDYKKALSNNIEEAYYLLDQEYREKRFGSIEEFKEYREEKVETLGKESFKEYLVNNYNDYKEYVCKDIYGNLYIFTEKYPMDYTLKLDTYTIPTDKFKSEYKSGSEQTKVQLNVNQFILMINNQDYEAAYNVLADSFKNNYFPTKESFIQYIKQRIYRYNNLKFSSFDKKGNTYICTALITDLTNGLYKDSTKGTGGSGYQFELNIVMQLGEEYDFEMSFEVK